MGGGSYNFQEYKTRENYGRKIPLLEYSTHIARDSARGRQTGTPYSRGDLSFNTFGCMISSVVSNGV